MTPSPLLIHPGETLVYFLSFGSGIWFPLNHRNIKVGKEHLDHQVQLLTKLGCNGENSSPQDGLRMWCGKSAPALPTFTPHCSACPLEAPASPWPQLTCGMPQPGSFLRPHAIKHLCSGLPHIPVFASDPLNWENTEEMWIMSQSSSCTAGSTEGCDSTTETGMQSLCCCPKQHKHSSWLCWLGQQSLLRWEKDI